MAFMTLVLDRFVYQISNRSAYNNKSVDNQIFGQSVGGQEDMPYVNTEVDTYIAAAYFNKVSFGKAPLLSVEHGTYILQTKIS